MQILIPIGFWKIPASSSDSGDIHTFYEDFKLPIDPINKFAISFIYNYPYEFNLGEFYEAINYNDSSGHSVLYKPDLNWGNDYL